MRKTADPDHLKIQLGLKCNYRCGYCLQRSSAGLEEKTSADDAEEFLRGLSSWLRGSPSQIGFWGGEPLLYERKLKILIPDLRRRFPAARFYLATNGSLLNDEWIDFFEAYDVIVAISHDGPNQSARGPDPLSKPSVRDAWTRLFRRRPGKASINFVLTPDSFDILAIEDWFRRAFPGTPVQTNVEGVVRLYAEDDRRFAFDDGLGAKLSEAVRARLQAPGRPSYFLELLAKILAPSLEQDPAGSPTISPSDERHPRCLTVDLKGTILASHNFAGAENVLGHVSDFAQAREPALLPVAGRPDCAACPVLRSCTTRGFTRDGVFENENCRNVFHFHEGVRLALVQRNARANRPEPAP